MTEEEHQEWLHDVQASHYEHFGYPGEILAPFVQDDDVEPGTTGLIEVSQLSSRILF